MVVDDEEKLNRLITYNLEKEGFVTTSVLDGNDVINQVIKYR